MSERRTTPATHATRPPLWLDQAGLGDLLAIHSPVGTAFLDEALVFRWVNPAYLEHARLTADELIGRPVHAVFPDAARPNPRLAAVLERGEALTATGVPWERLVDGRPVTTYWDARYVPVRDAAGAVRGVLVVSQDVTERERAAQAAARHAEALRRANLALLAVDQQKDEFLSVLSHELRTPLNFIVGFTSILEDELAGPLTPLQRQHLGRVQHGAAQMLGLVEDLLDVAKVTSGRLALAREDVRLAEAAAEAIAAVAEQAREKDVAIACDVPAALSVPGDAARLAQVIAKLLGNAIKFSPAGGCVALRAGAEAPDARALSASGISGAPGASGASAVRVTVEDAGIGIAPADQDRLFRRFGQLDMSPTRRAGGTGLGLALCRALVEAHGGAIGVASEPGRGSTFWFRLPAGRAEPPQNPHN